MKNKQQPGYESGQNTEHPASPQQKQQADLLNKSEQHKQQEQIVAKEVADKQIATIEWKKQQETSEALDDVQLDLASLHEWIRQSSVETTSHKSWRSFSGKTPSPTPQQLQSMSDKEKEAMIDIIAQQWRQDAEMEVASFANNVLPSWLSRLT